MSKLKIAVQALIADVEAMKNGKDTFGGFAVWEYADGDSMTVEWPNLVIDLEAVKAALAEEEIPQVVPDPDQPGRWQFNGCDISYDTQEEALAAARESVVPD